VEKGALPWMQQAGMQGQQRQAVKVPSSLYYELTSDTLKSKKKQYRAETRRRRAKSNHYQGLSQHLIGANPYSGMAIKMALRCKVG
jgi:hypothetical protein